MYALKAKAFDLFVWIITFLVVMLSYELTISVLEDLSSNQVALSVTEMVTLKSVITLKTESQVDTSVVMMDFFRNAFVFLSPCAIEGMNLLCSKITKKPFLDTVELAVGGLSICLSAYILCKVINGNVSVDLQWIRYMLLAYPVKIGFNLFNELFELLEMRRK